MNKSDNTNSAVRERIAEAERQAALAAQGYPSSGVDYDGEPASSITDGLDPDVIAYCAGLDHSDVDNAKRLELHFGQDLTVMAQSGADRPAYGGWVGTHWDFDNGPSVALATAQKLGGAIALETAYIGLTPAEDSVIKKWEELAQDKGFSLDADPADLGTVTFKNPCKAAHSARGAHAKRVARRHNHAVTSKNIGRMRAALDCLAPHIMADADDFNADAYRFACRSHTISLRLDRSMIDNPDLGNDPAAPVQIEARKITLKAEKGHNRKDRITAILPVDYNPKADCPKFKEWLAEFSPEPQVRRMLQVSTGIGLLGLAVQRLFFHYGKGANGKSVFMETIGRVLGELCITLPAESITGKQNGSGGPSPDLARLYGRRFLRVAELPQGEPLRIELIKKLTGGERFPVRDLFKGYFDFTPLFVAHMSGNGYPRTDETDNGTWRRLVVVKWPKTVPTAEQRDFEDVLADFEPEFSGILNWLIEGAQIFLKEGLVIAEESLAETQKYRDEMDPLAGFVNACLTHDEPDKEGIAARELYDLYVLWCSENGAKPISNTAFGKKMTGYNMPHGGEITKDTSKKVRFYRGCKVKYRPNGAPPHANAMPEMRG